MAASVLRRSFETPLSKQFTGRPKAKTGTVYHVTVPSLQTGGVVIRGRGNWVETRDKRRRPIGDEGVFPFLGVRTGSFRRFRT